MQTATYSPEDNKIRLRSDERLSPETYARVKAAGFVWAPRQEIFVAPAWTPEREDLALELCGEIGDEDTSLVERTEERAERFEDYSARRQEEADQTKDAVERISGQIPLGQPILVGHHSERRARKDAERIESGMRKAVNLWRTSQYWQRRAEGALYHAKYKERPDVRARRIKTLEADWRKQDRARKEAELWRRLWLAPGLTRERALAIANRAGGGSVVCGDGTTCWSAWSALEDNKITPEGAREQSVTWCNTVIARAERWLEHLDNRLAYERAMLGEQGGIAADRTKPEKGGACRCWCSPGHGKGWSIIYKVNKVSVTVHDNFHNGGEDFTRTIAFDKISALLTKQEVDEARAAGRLSGENSLGFYLLDEPVREARPYTPVPETDFDRMEDSLKQGIQTVSSPDLFPTPPDLARRLVGLLDVQPGDRVLEPSAGTGNLLRALPANCTVWAVEISPKLALSVQAAGWGCTCADFLEVTPAELQGFEKVIMNPPFSGRADIIHILHALKFLKPGGRLVALCANGPRQQERLRPLADYWEDLPEDTFKEQGTGVRVALLVINAREED